MNEVLKLLILLIFACIKSYAIEFNNTNKAVTDLFRNADVVFIGENHGIEESRDFIISILEIGLQNQLISSFSTEYILSNENVVFNSYLVDTLADPNSEREKEYFEKLQKNGLLWLTNQHTLDFFRKLRMLKLKYSQFHVCGIDEKAAMNVRDGRSEAEIRYQRYSGFSIEIQNALMMLTGKSLVDLGNDKAWYDREVLLAQRISECGSQTGMLVHMGSGHTYNPLFATPVIPSSWKPSTYFYSLISPATKTKHVQILMTNPKSDDFELMKKFVRNEYELLNNSELGSGLGFPFDCADRCFNDFYLLGPLGTWTEVF